jgi:hypothetical protein
VPDLPVFEIGSREPPLGEPFVDVGGQGVQTPGIRDARKLDVRDENDVLGHLATAAVFVCPVVKFLVDHAAKPRRVFCRL